jgi:hypothetical protein
VTENKQVWLDIPVSTFTVKCEYSPVSPPVCFIVLNALLAFCPPPVYDEGALGTPNPELRSFGIATSTPHALSCQLSTFVIDSCPSRTDIATSLTFCAAIVAAVVENVPNAALVHTQGKPKPLQLISVNPDITPPAIENTKAACSAFHPVPTLAPLREEPRWDGAKLVAMGLGDKGER